MKSVVRAIKVLELLKEHSDADNPLTQAKILELLKQNGESCTEKTLRNTLRGLQEALSSYYDFTDRKIAFTSYGTTDDLQSDDDAEQERMTNLYYVHDFSEDDIDALLESVHFSKRLSEGEIAELKQKLINQRSKYYKDNTKQIRSVTEFPLTNSEQLRASLMIIQQAIEKQVKITFDMWKLTRKREKTPFGSEYVVSPYYAVAYNGRYYMIANYERYDNASIYRIDRMLDVRIAQRNSIDNETLSARSINDIKGLETDWSTKQLNKYMTEHMYMFYDDPMIIHLKVKNNDYTFLYDWFGESFEFERHLDQEHDSVRVVCSPGAMVHWAMQYSSKVEIIGPKKMRDMFIAQLREVMIKYGLQEN